MSVTASLLWPAADGPEALAEIERVPIADRGLPASTYAVLARAAELWPDRPATSFLPDAERWEQPSRRTFAEALRDVHRVAAILHDAGVRRRDAVALLSVNCEELWTAVLAAEAVGIAAPINPGLAAGHTAELIRTAGARVLVASGPELDLEAWERARALATETGVEALFALRPTAPGAAPELASAPTLAPLAGVRVAYLAELAGEHEGAALPAAPPVGGDIASYLHTGGTTGTPKLAARSHAAEVANAWMIATGSPLADDSTVFAALPLFHTNALLVTSLAPLLRGQHVVWAGPLGYRDVPLYGVFWRLVERYRVAAMSAVPTVYAVLAEVPVDADISSLRLPIVGAAPLPPAVADRFHAATGVDLCEGYGLTEATCATSRNWPGAVRRGTVGQRMPYQEVRAVRVDETSGEWTFLPPGERGMLVIRGPVVFAGYVRRAGTEVGYDTGGKVRDGWLETGDLGSVDADGYLTLAGRAKDLIIRGGHNIDPLVIEEALLAHPAVTGAGAVGRPDLHAGEVPVAYVTLAPGAAAREDELIAWAAERVSERAAVPKAVTAVDAIPVTAVGKPYKPELRRRAVESAVRAALAEHDPGVRVELVDGTPVVTVTDVARDTAAAALSGLALTWRVQDA